jgi:hypothetical protein
MQLLLRRLQIHCTAPVWIQKKKLCFSQSPSVLIADHN